MKSKEEILDSLTSEFSFDYVFGKNSLAEASLKNFISKSLDTYAQSQVELYRTQKREEIEKMKAQCDEDMIKFQGVDQEQMNDCMTKKIAFSQTLSII